LIIDRRLVMKKIFYGLMLLVCAVLCTNIFAVNSKQTLVAINRVVAVVNDQVITEAQLNDELIMIKKRLEKAGTPLPSNHILKEQVIQQMINQTLQLQLAKRTGVRISHHELNAALLRIAKQNHQTMHELYQSVKQQGWTVDGFRQEIRDEITIQKLQSRELAPHISISQQEVDDYLQSSGKDANKMPKYRLGDILIALPDTPSPSQVTAAKKKANIIVKKLKAGADFKKLAVSVSGDASEALKGGDLGWRKLAELPSVFADKVSHMKTGEIAGPIQAPNGFHVIKLLGKHRGVSTHKQEEVEAQVIFMKHGDSLAANDAIKNRLEGLRKQLEQGNGFEHLAKKYSQDKKTSKEGGYLGWISVNHFGGAIATKLKEMKAGQISQPISVSDGWYLIQVIAKRQTAKTTATKKREIEQLIFRRKLNEATQTFLNQLRTQSYIKVYLD